MEAHTDMTEFRMRGCVDVFFETLTSSLDLHRLMNEYMLTCIPALLFHLFCVFCGRTNESYDHEEGVV